tara:strand:- start:319 stop:1794 length:1476 start_codon:yes stop_codon:yes gene_type:complete
MSRSRSSSPTVEPDEIYEHESKPECATATRLGSSEKEVSKWLGFNSGRFYGASNNARAAFIDAKANRIWSEPTGKGMPASLAYGITNERKAVDAYRAFQAYDETHWTYQPGFKTYNPTGNTAAGTISGPFFGAAPDALIGTAGLLEVKCPYSLRDDPDDNVYLKDEWILQALGQIYAYDRQWCDIMVWHPDFIWLWRILRDDKKWHASDPDGCGKAVKRDRDGEAIASPNNDAHRLTFMEAAWPEIEKFVVEPGSMGSDHDTILRMNQEWRVFKSNAVLKLDVFKEWQPAWYARPSDRVDPTRDLKGIVDRFANPLSKNESRPIYDMGIFLNVHFHNIPENGEFWTHGDDERTMGGYITRQYWRYVPEKAFMLAEELDTRRSGYAQGLIPMPNPKHDFKKGDHVQINDTADMCNHYLGVVELVITREVQTGSLSEFYTSARIGAIAVKIVFDRKGNARDEHPQLFNSSELTRVDHDECLRKIRSAKDGEGA